MMNKLAVQSIALVLLVAAFPLVSWGTTGGNNALWWLGIAALVIGGLLPVLTRFTAKKATADARSQDETERNC
jgi:uncharacterized membrane protein